MQPVDLPAVHALQCRAYPAGYHESQQTLASHLAAGPELCFVAEQAGALAGYVFAHPWAGDPPALFAQLPMERAPDHVFLHDLAVCPDCRGLSVGPQLFAAVESAARHTTHVELRLVAVGRASGFWARLGFGPMQGVLPESYGEAVRMRRSLSRISPSPELQG
ncbi:MAG: hypothetical protein BSR46_08285 [Candidatus Dactylopiibacterium carminicum]|nr:MAG: hypothetical protein BSR46_08285 [Candidatus Dactylopiibacterium carminicum]